MTAALEGGEWSAARRGHALPPGKTRYPLYRMLGGPQVWSGRAENLVPTGIRSQTVQPMVSRFDTVQNTKHPVRKKHVFLVLVLKLYCTGILHTENEFKI